MKADLMPNLKLVLIVGVVGLWGCGDDPPPPAAAAPPAAAPAKKAAAPASTATDAGVLSAPYVYAYVPLGKRDPFRNSRLAEDEPQTPTGPPTEGEDACDDPLCKSELDYFTLVAVISGDSNPMAMVEDSNKIGHLVHRNSKIGRQGGKVTAILRDCIVVTSFVRGPDGRAQPNRQNLCVKKELKHQPVLDLMVGKMRE
ncbi:MAG: pilus assembly protein PilP [Archangium sp.]|nr:pilus assembly protein PilP [Archangium sp.]